MSVTDSPDVTMTVNFTNGLSCEYVSKQNGGQLRLVELRLQEMCDCWRRRTLLFLPLRASTAPQAHMLRGVQRDELR